MVLHWPSQYLGLNLSKMFWPDLKRGVRKATPTNLYELKQCCKEEWASD